jgi:opacity protein-like surface antigen
MKRKILLLSCLAFLVVATMAQAQDSSESGPKFLVGVGIGARMVTGDTPVPRLGETGNLSQAGIHAVYNLNTTYSLVTDWAYAWDKVKYESTGGGQSVISESEATGWNLNALIAAKLNVGDKGGHLYAGPGIAVINMSVDKVRNSNGTISNEDRTFGTNMGLALGAGAVMPLSDKWHAFFSYRHTLVTGKFVQSTESTSVKGDVPLGGPSVIIGGGMGF